MSGVLGRILADKRIEVAARKAEHPAIDADARAAAAPRGFAAALARAVAASGTGLIAEIKKASPSNGLIRKDFDPAALARAYAAGGAACLSVLTDAKYFQGSAEALVAARAAVDLPVLRKDFLIDPWQVAEARAMNADCILVILSAVDDGLAAELLAAAAGLGMDALVEVHDEAEMDRAAAVGARLIGINNRNLDTLAIGLAVTERLAPRAPAGADLVCESGLDTPADLERAHRAGAHRFLVGTSLMKRDDVAAATAALLAPAAQMVGG
ncbi:MAG: indole-3-glycerol phosphate synthase TrpC [Proteobacteria bacterium]|nr:indole-3-glycerol phosphate synthase TrpC [Pseudomonadota bacterium]